MSKQVRWLREQIDRWTADGLVTSEQAVRLRALYPEPGAALPWAMIIFAGLGAVIVGLGVILLFAYNWQEIPRAGKLAVIFLAIVASHGAGVTLLRQPGRWQALGDVFCLLGTMFFGAAIWLIAQIYHIDEHFPNGFLFWGLGALALAWALPSTLQGLLAAVVLAIWSGSEAVAFDAPIFWAPPFIVVTLVTLAWKRESVLLLFVTLAAVAVATLISAGAVHGSLVMRTALSLGALYVALGVVSRQTGWFATGAWVWTSLGWALFILPVYLLTFHFLVYEMLLAPHAVEPGRDLAWHVQLWAPLGLAIAAWAAVVAGRSKTRLDPPEPAWRYEDWLTPLAATVAAALAFVPFEREEWLPAGLFNLLLLLLAVAWMARGCREGRLRPALAGAGLFVALAAGRYFDLFESLATRGLVFLLVGAGLFATGLQYNRARKRQEAEKGGQP